MAIARWKENCVIERELCNRESATRQVDVKCAFARV